jgi:hypothetical protein
MFVPAAISPRQAGNHLLSDHLPRKPKPMRVLVLSTSLLIAVSGAALAQSTIPVGGTVLPPLASPNIPENTKPSDALRAAQGALAAGRVGEAQEALEMAQTRMLDRSVVLGQTNIPSDDPTVGQISRALQALAAHDRATCAQFIQSAIGSATAQGL